MLRRRRIQQYGQCHRCEWQATSRVELHKVLEPMHKKLLVRSEAPSLLNLRHLDWTTIFTTAACNLRFERFGPPLLCQLRHGGASHEVFTASRDVTGKGTSGDHVVATRLPASNNSSQRLLLWNFGAKRLVAKSWLSCCRLAAKWCLQRDRRNKTPPGQRSRADGSAMDTHSLLEYPHVSCVRAPAAGVSSFGADGLQCHVKAFYGLAELVASCSPSTDRISPTNKHGWLPLLVLFWQRPSGPAVP